MALERNPVILFDGECPLCNFWVAFVLKHDQEDLFRFAALQSNYGQSFLKKNGYDTQTFDTLFLLLPQAGHLNKSTAVLRILKLLGGLWKLLSFAGSVLPRRWRDKLYDAVAARRKKLMKDQCPMLSLEQRKKFIDSFSYI